MNDKENNDIAEKDISEKPRKRKIGFLIFYSVFILALVGLAVYAVDYVSSVLVEYEAAQPDKIAVDCAEELWQAARENRLDKVLSFETVKKEIEITDKEYEKLQQNIAEGVLTVKKAPDTEGEKDTLCYGILLNDTVTVAKYRIKSVGQETKLAIFPIDRWEKHPPEATMYCEEFSLPLSVSAYLNGEKAEGKLSEDGKSVSYRLCSINEPDIVITDVLGNSVPYSNEGKYSFKQYKLTVPSNFTVKGKEALPPTSEERIPIEEIAHLYADFPDAPVLRSYDLIVMEDCIEDCDYPLTVLDNNGQRVDISEMGDIITVTRLSSSSLMPTETKNPPDPLEIAKRWSLFMTNDLKGERNGFYTMSKYLFKDSELYNRAWEWATGMDITFTSTHTLAKPPFAREEIKNFISYTDKCFSCEILLEKLLYLNTGRTVTDTMHSKFFFGYIDETDNGKDDPHWGIIDAVSIIE